MIDAPALMGLAVTAPLAGAVLIALAGRRALLRDALTLATAATLLGLVLALYTAYRAGERPGWTAVEMIPGMPLALELEPLGMLFALVAAGLYAITAVYAVGYMRANDEDHQARFHAWFAVAMGAAMSVALSANLLSLFVSYEVLTLATWPLVAHHGDEAARRGGRTYLTILLSTSITLLLFAILWTWHLAGTLSFTPGGILSGRIDGAALGVLLALYLFGIGKAALMPVHRWLPAAMVAPTPVSALLHAVAVVKAGVFGVIKIVVYIFGTEWLTSQTADDWAVYVAAFTVVAASIIALRQDDLKRRLAYSTVSQLGYVVMSTLVLAPVSVLAAALHIAAHACAKITLFFAAGAIHTAAHKTRVSQLDGIGRRMPWTLGAFAVASLSMIGIPPTIGFLSKWYMLSGAWQSGAVTVITALTLSTLLNAAYLLPIVHAAFFRAPQDTHAHGEAPALMVAPLTVTASLTVVLFVFPDVPWDLAHALMEVNP